MTQPNQSLEKADEPLQDIMDWGKYHAATYRCLVGKGPLEAGDVVVRTNVPRGRIYDVLEDLVEEGVVTYREGNPREYRAQNPEGLLQERKDEFENKATGLIETLGNAYQLNLPDESSSSAWILGSRSGTVRKLREVLEEAEKSIRALEPDPRWYETSDCRVLEEHDREKVNIELVVWNARQDKLKEIASFNFPIWESENVDKMFYIIDNEKVIFRVDGGDTGIIFSDKSMANVFIKEFEDTFRESNRFDPNA